MPEVGARIQASDVLEFDPKQVNADPDTRPAADVGVKAVNEVNVSTNVGLVGTFVKTLSTGVTEVKMYDDNVEVHSFTYPTQ